MSSPQISPQALASLVSELGQVDDASLALTVLLQYCGARVGAAQGAILQADPDGEVTVLHHADAPDLPKAPPTTTSVWPRAVWDGQQDWQGRSWDREADAPAAFRHLTGWTTGMLVPLPTRLPGLKRVVALGDLAESRAGHVNDVTEMAAAAAPVIDIIQLQQAQSRARSLLERVAELATALASAASPTDLLTILTRGLAAMKVADAAVVWTATPDPGQPPEAVGDLPLELEALDARSQERVARLLGGGVSRAVVSMLSEPAAMEDGRLLTLHPISHQPARLLGLVHTRAFDQDERRVISALIGGLAPAIKQAEMALERRSLVADFSRMLRPVAVPEKVDLAVEHHPNTSAADLFGGDFYEWFSPEEGRVVVALGDVAGKGIAAAAASGMVLWSLRALGSQGASPGLLTHLLDLAVSNELDADRFVTLVLADIDLRTWTMRIVLAGQPPPIFLGTQPPAEGIESDRPLGVMPDGPAFTSRSVTLEPGQRIVLYTDGAIDVRGHDGVRLGVDPLAAHAERLHEMGADVHAIATGLWRLVCDHADGAPDDDCAIVVIGRPVEEQSG